jgi:23S rRNA (cytosine1962-C5)-methyltransferase
VLDLDLSAHALESGERNCALNHSNAAVAACQYDQVQGDAFGWLADSPPREFDVVVVDPPSLAKREVERERAIEAYGRLASSAIRRVRPGGVLVSASCSAHVSEEEFFTAVRTGQHGRAGVLSQRSPPPARPEVILRGFPSFVISKRFPFAFLTPCTR